MEPFVPAENTTNLPTIHVVSDSMGLTARAIARAAAIQFGVSEPCIETVSKVESFEELVGFLEEHKRYHIDKTGSPHMLVFFTIVNRVLAKRFSRYAAESDYLTAVDILTPSLDAMEQLAGFCPSYMPGRQHVADQRYFKRIEAEEFTIDHDDGRNPQDLPRADIVLIGVSRTSKTPLSLYLSRLGYKTANVPLDPQSAPPKEIYEVDKTRLFGLMTTVEVLTGIRKRRFGSEPVLAGNYADPEYIYRDLEKSRELMRQLGCIVIRTDNRAVEESAQEILRHYERWHPVRYE